MEKAYRIDWCSIHFDDITVSLKRGPFGSSLKKAFFVPKGYKVYEQKNAINDDNTLGDYYIDESKYDELEAFSIHPGDYIVSCSGTIGKISRLPEDTEPGIINQALLRIRIDERIIAHRFFQYLFKSMYLQSKILVDSRGTGMKNLAGVKELRKIHFFLPPLLEQRAIVSKIEQLFSDLDNGIENFKKAQEQLKIYRQAVLKNACEGKLVPTEAELACVEGRDYEPADVLLARILKERREKWNGKGKYKEPVVSDTSGLSELPEGWRWTNMECTGEVSGGLTKNSKRNKLFQQMPYIRVANVYADKLKLEDIANIGIKESEIERVLLEKGDLLVVEGNGSLDQIGRAALWEGSISPCVHQNHIIKVRFNPTKIAKYILLWLLSKKGRKEITNVASSTSGLYTLSISKVASLFVPLPPLAEQRRIVAEVERRLSLSDKMEATIAESLQKAEALRQSILKKAFEGKLLNEKELEEARNALDWEPVEKLLERIKAQKNN
ncbi:MAG: type I restriction enzyme, S subunit [Candidatus Methanocomedens sp.]|nr:MAG: type I restriction enzyme, S subunit [ANME-2 cluster archaeon]